MPTMPAALDLAAAVDVLDSLPGDVLAALAAALDHLAATLTR